MKFLKLHDWPNKISEDREVTAREITANFDRV